MTDQIIHALQHPPCFIGRIAGIELQMAYHLKQGTLQDVTRSREELETNAGIHVSTPASLHQYVERLLTSYDHCTHIAEWDTSGPVYDITGKGQEFIAQRCPTTPRFNAMALEPYYEENSGWMPYMKGKHVLVIHPFAETFQKQITQFDKLFPNRPWFPYASFTFMKPPMTLAGNHGNKDWQEHLNAFLPSLHGIQCDVALVAAGGYGMLISDYLYTTLHTSVLYIGGALQLFFGVIGKRWFTHPRIMKLVTEEWVRPSKEEQPADHKKVEKGCYW